MSARSYITIIATKLRSWNKKRSSVCRIVPITMPKLLTFLWGRKTGMQTDSRSVTNTQDKISSSKKEILFLTTLYWSVYGTRSNGVGRWPVVLSGDWTSGWCYASLGQLPVASCQLPVASCQLLNAQGGRRSVIIRPVLFSVHHTRCRMGCLVVCNTHSDREWNSSFAVHCTVPAHLMHLSSAEQDWG